MGRGTLTRAPIQELYDPTFESVANLDDLQRSWETLKNVVCEWYKASAWWFIDSQWPLSCFQPWHIYILQFVFQQISEKQRSLYEALEKQQHYQSSLQSISSKMEGLEAKLSEPLEADKSPDSHFRAHEVSHYNGNKVFE